ncbi:hypothetical protein N7509_011224 [Penicillium cosmopolitanum]|uniref:Uncharacterized protein n=1 Tax=Penicillium cosmopolitanum TaxID=1131564 RepID=A0A9X0B5B5_9EURO|nr:uncharacterized protein N7509_011224 [Penicillium cosmopolitanum]KAJ5388683.1 hypothetical protein N7509_011224 [Penicillium cosmopolitanum]
MIGLQPVPPFSGYWSPQTSLNREVSVVKKWALSSHAPPLVVGSAGELLIHYESSPATGYSS